jgi:hypothetical protein
MKNFNRTLIKFFSADLAGKKLTRPCPELHPDPAVPFSNHISIISPMAIDVNLCTQPYILVQIRPSTPNPSQVTYQSGLLDPSRVSDLSRVTDLA